MSFSGTSRRLRLAVTAAAALALALVLTAPVAGAVPAASQAAPVAGAAPAASQAAPAGWPSVAADSMAKDLGITRADAVQRLQAQDQLAALSTRLDGALGARGAGSYVDAASGKLVVNVLDSAAARQVRAAGATPRVVANSLGRLESVKAALDRTAAAPGLAWGIDLASNAVVVSVPAGRMSARAAAFVTRASSLGSGVRVERVAGAYQPAAFFGGQAMLTGGSRCTSGFITQRGGAPFVITAGHCTNIGSTWRTSGGQTIGTTASSSFPGNDYGSIRISNPNALDPRGGVLVNGQFRDITSAGRVPVGSQVCKTGSTTGTTCGRVTRYNVTVRYAQGTVFGLTETTVCTQPGDSGGSVWAGSQAQAVVSGGTIGSCNQAGFRSIHQPADEILGALGMTLL